MLHVICYVVAVTIILSYAVVAHPSGEELLLKSYYGIMKKEGKLSLIQRRKKILAFTLLSLTHFLLVLGRAFL